MTRSIEWPPLKVGLGPAMTKQQVADYMGKSISAVEAAQRRTRRGEARVAFPRPAGHAVPPDAAKEVPVAYWFERDIKRYVEDFERVRAEVIAASRGPRARSTVAA